MNHKLDFILNIAFTVNIKNIFLYRVFPSNRMTSTLITYFSRSISRQPFICLIFFLFINN